MKTVKILSLGHAYTDFPTSHLWLGDGDIDSVGQFSYAKEDPMQTKWKHESHFGSVMCNPWHEPMPLTSKMGEERVH